MVARLCDTAVFYNDEKHYELSEIRCNSQACVEKACLHMACSPSIEQQLLYTDERLQDILEIHQNLSKK